MRQSYEKLTRASLKQADVIITFCNRRDDFTGKRRSLARYRTFVKDHRHNGNENGAEE